MFRQRMFKVELEKNLNNHSQIKEALRNGLEKEELAKMVDNAYANSSIVPLLQRYSWGSLQIDGKKATDADMVELLTDHVLSSLQEKLKSESSNVIKGSL